MFTLNALREKLDRISSLYVRNYGRCEKCGAQKNLTNSHILGRNNIKTQFDPRNLQAICATDHQHFTDNPKAHKQYVKQSSCEKYVDIMRQQSQNSLIKPDYNLWLTIYDLIATNNMSLPQAREWLNQTVIWHINDIPPVYIQ